VYCRFLCCMDTGTALVENIQTVSPHQDRIYQKCDTDTFWIGYI